MLQVEATQNIERCRSRRVRPLTTDVKEAQVASEKWGTAPGNPETEKADSEAPPAEETIKSTELHYATIDFGYNESKKITKTTESTAYATIRTDSKDDTDDYDVAPPAEETIKSTELHYASIDFGYTESKKFTKTTESTAYATIRTDSKDDTDDYDVVIVR
ncbi:uncharacterized protein LOC143981725 isoform X2 [Lithobates pipiens]